MFTDICIGCSASIFDGSNRDQANSVNTNVANVTALPMVRIVPSDLVLASPRNNAPIVGRKMISVRRASLVIIDQTSLKPDFQSAAAARRRNARTGHYVIKLYVIKITRTKIPTTPTTMNVTYC